MISSSSGLTPSELISIARALAVLAEHVKLPDAPYFIWGNNIDQAALAEALSASAYTKELFAEGILFVPEIYEDIGGNGYIHRLSIEGIGSTPLKAKMNSLAGGFRTEMHDLSEEVDRFFLKESLFPATGGKRLMNREVGFFMRRKNNGEWYVAKKKPVS